jgi:selenocysteine lyase/cysteine desulfurase
VTTLGPGPGGEAAPLDALRSALTPRTKVLAVCHVSNLLGEIVDIPAVGLCTLNQVDP